MKIGITCYPTYGGSGVLASELGKFLAKRGHEIHFITSTIPYRLQRDFQDRIYFHTVDMEPYPLFEHPPYDLALAAKMKDVFVSERAGSAARALRHPPRRERLPGLAAAQAPLHPLRDHPARHRHHPGGAGEELFRHHPLQHQREHRGHRGFRLPQEPKRKRSSGPPGPSQRVHNFVDLDLFRPRGLRLPSGQFRAPGAARLHPHLQLPPGQAHPRRDPHLRQGARRGRRRAGAGGRRPHAPRGQGTGRQAGRAATRALPGQAARHRQHPRLLRRAAVPLRSRRVSAWPRWRPWPARSP